MKELLPILIPTAFPTLMVLVGILLNQTSVDRLDARISGLDSRFSGIDQRIDRMRDQHHSDMMLLMGRDIEVNARIPKLEEKSGQ